MSGARANAVLVEALGSSLRRGGNALQDVPGLLKRILKEEAWREFVTPRGEVVRYERFSDFVMTPPTAGLGAELDLVRRIVAADIEALDLFDRALHRPVGRPAEMDNNVIDSGDANPQGNSKGRALRRLRQDAPELHAEVLAGRMSAHAAMVKAGFRRRTLSIPLDEPERTARALRQNLSPEAVQEVARLLAAGEN